MSSYYDYIVLNFSLENYFNYIRLQTNIDVLYNICHYILRKQRDLLIINYNHQEQEFLDKKYILARTRIDQVYELQTIKFIFKN